MNLQVACNSIWHAPVKDRNAFGQLLHAAVLSNWGKKQQRGKRTLQLLASDNIYHCFEVKIGPESVEIVEYNIFQAGIIDDDFKNMIGFCRVNC